MLNLQEGLKEIGARYRSEGLCSFCVWAPFVRDLTVRIFSEPERKLQMQKDSQGYFSVTAEKILPGTLYAYASSQFQNRADPASYYQPQGVHGPSQVIDHAAFCWHDQQYCGIPLSELIIYELHVGTFTAEGTFDAAIDRLDDLCDLGINAIEIMPVAQFPGDRNWGYDGVDLFAVQNSYGGPDGLKRLVDAAHQKDIAVILDVVYNHFGPEGNYLNDFGPYFTSKYKTPWGRAINFDDTDNRHVRHFFIENAVYWFEHFHMDALRLDAIHAIHDESNEPFLAELSARVNEFSNEQGRARYLIAESDLNDIKVIQERGSGGFGLHAQWSDDFHHALHSVLTKEDNGYYQDFGGLTHLKKAFKATFVNSGNYSEFRKKLHGTDAADIPSDRFVIFLQNHDQVGNRLLGERLSRLASIEELKLAAGLLLFSPYIPLLFMGEEYAEEAPFNYFISHSDQKLINAVRRGRQREFSSFAWKGKAIDPQAAETFLQSKLKWEKRQLGHHQSIYAFYKELIRLRKQTPALKRLNKFEMDVEILQENIFYIRRWYGQDQLICMANFSEREESFTCEAPTGRWIKIVDSADKKWAGLGVLLKDELIRELRMPPKNFAAYVLRV